MQVLLVLHGIGAFTDSGHLHEMSDLSVIVVRPGIAFTLKHCQALQLITCRFDPDEDRKRLGDSFDPRALSMLLNGRSVQKFDIAAERFRSLVALISMQTKGGEMGNLGRLLILLETIVEAGSPELPSIHRAVLQTIEKFEADLKRDWTLPELAQALDLDPSYLARIFKSSVGLPPIAYLALMRSEAASKLLADTRLSCSEIGNRVGWQDPNYFSRRFRQHFGESPTTYRDRIQA
jgi:AraC family L-rhamnose operon transcriptional activator RhaR